MTTTEQTANKLTVKFMPWFTWIFAAFFLVVNLPIFMTILLQSIPQELSCKRIELQQINCQLKTSILPLLPSKIIVIEGLQAAKFKSQSYNNYRNPNQIPYERQKIVLLTQTAEIFFLSYKIYHPEYATQKMLAWESQINAFVNNPQQQSFKLKTSIIEPPWFVMTTPRWFILVGIINSIFIIIFMGEISICEFNRVNGFMTKKQRWLFVFTKTSKYSLLDIKDLQLECNQQRGNTSRITIILASGKKIPLSTYHANYFKSEKKMKITADKISNFLSLSTI